MRRIDTLVIHHSASASGDVDTIRAQHRRRGYTDIGYHNVIGNGHGLPDGHISAGRPHAKVGAGVYGNNGGKLHVCLIGNFHRADPGYTGPPTIAQMGALGWWLLVNGHRYDVERYERVVGHGEVTVPGHGTACPGTEMPLREIRLWYRENLPKFEQREFEALPGYLKRQGVEMR